MLLYAGIILFVASFIQTIAGFAFSLLAVPLLLFCGFDLPSSVALSMAGSAVQRTLMTWQYRKCIEWKPLFKMCPLAIVGLIAGIFILKEAALLEPDTVKQIFGIIILAAVGMRLFIHIEPRDSVPFSISGTTAFFSGLMNGFANIGGPPMVFWILAHKWTKDRLRATIPAFSLMLVPLQIVLLGISFGMPIIIEIVKGLLLFPLILAAVYLGHHCSHKLSTARIRVVIIILLTIIGTSYILYPLIKKILS